MADFLDPRLREALSITGDEERKAALVACCSYPRRGNDHVLTVPILTRAACRRLRRAVVEGNERSDGLRAGAGKAADNGEQSSSSSSERQRWLLRNDFTTWLYATVLRPLASAAFADMVLLPPSTAPPAAAAAAAATGPSSSKEGNVAAPSHHSYVLNYKRTAGGASRDDAKTKTRLGFHTDDADLTVNISLGPTTGEDGEGEEGSSNNGFTGGDLLFCDDPSPAAPRQRPGTPDLAEEAAGGRLWRLAHSAGVAVVHDGTAYHAAAPIEPGGERTQLIYWCLKGDAKWKETFYGELESELAREVASPAPALAASSSSSSSSSSS